MKALEIFTELPLVKKIKAHEIYLGTLQEELEVRNSYDSFKIEPEDPSFDYKIKRINNRKAIALLQLEIDSKINYITELKQSLLRDKTSYKLEYEDYVKKSQGVILKERVKALSDSLGFKTPQHRNWISYQAAELEIYEQALQDEQAKGNTDTDGIIEGIVWFYHQLGYAIKDHDNFKITSK